MFQQQQPLYFSDAYSQPAASSNQYTYSSIPGLQPQQFKKDLDTSTSNFITAPTGLWGSVAGQQQQQQQQLHQQQIPLRPLQRQCRPHYNNRDIIPKMETVSDDYEAQQALAGGYAPKLEVRSYGSESAVCRCGDNNTSTLPEYLLIRCA